MEINGEILNHTNKKVPTRTKGITLCNYHCPGGRTYLRKQ